jgi:hypothetical protein
MRFGGAVKINSDYIVVGASMDNRNGFRSGSIYIYKISDPNYLRIITPSDGRSELRWPTSIAINEEYILLGSRSDNTYFSQAGAVYAYRFDDYTYQHKFYASEPSLSASFGPVDINNNNIVVIGAYHETRENDLEGAVYLYDLDNKTHLRKITPSESKRIYRFGRIVKIDDTHILVSTDSTREVYLYSIEDPEFERIFIEQTRQKHANVNSNTYYGSDIMFHEDYIIVAAYNHIHEIFNNGASSRAGSIYVYRKDDESYRKELKAPAFTIEFGKAMFVIDDTLVIRGRERLTTSTSSYYFHTTSFVDATKILISDDSPFVVELYKDDVLIPYNLTGMITQPGEYKVVAIDTSGNKTEVTFSR